MKRNLKPILPLAVLLAVSCTGTAPVTEDGTDWPEVQTIHKPYTRWWWLGSAVDSANLTYNLEKLTEAGIGGVEITPIYGVQGNESRDIPYLSPRWMKMYVHTVEEARRLGMDVDLNNGTGWPFGGPDITPELAATRLLVRQWPVRAGHALPHPIVPEEPAQAEVFTLSRLVAYSPDGSRKLDLTDQVSPEGRLLWTAPEAENDSRAVWTVYALFNGKTLQKVKRAAPGGEGLVMDHFSKAALATYLRRIDSAFKASGAPAPRNFFNDSYEVHRADWTPDFPAEFSARRGYKLEDYLPALLANDSTDVSRRVVSDYRQTVAEVFMDNFVTPWTEWVHGMGSLVRNQSHGSPGNLVDIYASVDIPECETFGRTRFDIPGLAVDSGMRLNDSNPAVLKFASSAAHIAGKPLTSAETFTWLTEHFRTALSQCKPEIDQMFASGVNHVFFHGTPYSPRDAEWPGWLFYAAINMSPTNSIWKDAPAFFRYIARCQSFLQQGQPDNDFLLYVPIYDFWNDWRGDRFMPFSIHNMLAMIPEFDRTVAEIMDAGYDLDYISDTFIASLRYENGELVTSGGSRYKALIVPDNRLMPTETLEKILALTRQGATVVFSDRYPADVPGLSDLAARRKTMDKLRDELPEASFGKVTVHPLGAGNIVTGKGYGELLAMTEAVPEAFKTGFGGQYVRRKTEDGNIYFFTLLRNAEVDGWVTLGREAASVMLFDPMTGRKGLARTRTENGQTQVRLQLRPDQSVILRTFREETVEAEPWEYLEPQTEPLALAHGWSLKFVESEPAVGGTFVTDTLCSWTMVDDRNAAVNMGTARYTTAFDLPETKADEWLLDLGDVRESARVRINGQDAGTLWAIPFTAQVGRFLKPGRNTLEVEVTNLPANRIADYDRRGVKWRKFKDINIVSIFYKPITFDTWATAPSGLLGPVTLTPMQKAD